MPRGGSRPGAGRKPSAAKADLKAKAPKAAAKKAPAKPPPEAAAFAPKGEKLPSSPAEWPFGTSPPAPPPPAPPAPPAADLSNLTPLDYLLQVVRDEEMDQRIRIQAAAIAAPYVHGKVAPVGKKAAKLDAAKATVAGGGGRFQAAAPPKLAAANGKKV
jgi:phage terminase small subunit